MPSWKRDFASGLVVTLPIVVLAIVIGWVFTNLQQLGVASIDPMDWPAGYENWIPVAEVALTLVLFTLLVFSVGYLMRTTAGRLVEDLLDAAINRVPVLRIVYNASKLAVETALTGTDELQSPVKVEAWPGMRMTAFKTGKTTPDGREVIFLPTAPNITTGFVIEVASEDITETDESVEEALTRVLSAGFGEKDQGVPIDVEGPDPVRRDDGDEPEDPVSPD